MTSAKTNSNSSAPRAAHQRSCVLGLNVASVVLFPWLWSISGCSSDKQQPNADVDPGTTSDRVSSGSTSGASSVVGTTNQMTTTVGMTGTGTSTTGSNTGASTATTVSHSSENDTGSATASSGSETSASNTTGSTASSGSDNSGSGGTDTSAPQSGASGDGGLSEVDAGSEGNSDDPLSPGCGTVFQEPPPDGEQQTVDIDGSTRYYLMDVPDDADNETPLMLIFALHGFDMNNIAVVDLFNFTERSAGQAITVWPQGEGPHPGDVPHWGDQVLESTWSSNEQNYAFLRQLMTDLGERYCIDRERTFIAGFSMGGFFTNQLACDHSDWFRAFAPVAGGGPQNCTNGEVQSAIMLQHGTADDIVEISSGEGSRDFWVEQNGCNPSFSNSLANCQFHDGCADDKPVAWCTGNYDHYIPDEVASNIWSFFSSF